MTYYREVSQVQEQSLIDEATSYIVPNEMQKAALLNLEELRATGAKKRASYFCYWNWKNLLISF